MKHEEKKEDAKEEAKRFKLGESVIYYDENGNKHAATVVDVQENGKVNLRVFAKAGDDFRAHHVNQGEMANDKFALSFEDSIKYDQRLASVDSEKVKKDQDRLLKAAEGS